jgi:hypothetical protein
MSCCPMEMESFRLINNVEKQILNDELKKLAVQVEKLLLCISDDGHTSYIVVFLLPSQ